MSRVRIEDARVVITGAGSGIGRAAALRCAGAGADVVCVDIDGDAAQETVDLAGSGAACACDVADPDAVVALAESIEADRGPVDVVVNNAGVGIAGPFLAASLEDWAWLRSINLDGVVYGCHAFGARMVERRHGHVVNIASMAAYTANRNLAAYCASKAAVVSFSQSLRADWRRHGVGVSVICPGVINTPIAARTRMFGGMVAKQERAVRAMGLGHSPDVVAKAIVSAVERNRDLVPVGIESAIAFRVLRLAPGPVQGLIARSGMP
jgi:NAD(P)-dependent dehydrogenase (short-subunit alcohol dehydrogenase family)